MAPTRGFRRAIIKGDGAIAGQHLEERNRGARAVATRRRRFRRLALRSILRRTPPRTSIGLVAEPRSIIGYCRRTTGSVSRRRRDIVPVTRTINSGRLTETLAATDIVLGEWTAIYGSSPPADSRLLAHYMTPPPEPASVKLRRKANNDAGGAFRRWARRRGKGAPRRDSGATYCGQRPGYMPRPRQREAVSPGRLVQVNCTAS